jgi:hypothetical protein
VTSSYVVAARPQLPTVSTQYIFVFGQSPQPEPELDSSLFADSVLQRLLRGVLCHSYPVDDGNSSYADCTASLICEPMCSVAYPEDARWGGGVGVLQWKWRTE